MKPLAQVDSPRAAGGEVWENCTDVRTPATGCYRPGGMADQPAKDVIDVAILPHPAPPVSSTLYATRMSTLDGCPECVTNAETPSSTYDDGAGRFVANYVCLACGHAWMTSWRD